MSSGSRPGSDGERSDSDLFDERLRTPAQELSREAISAFTLEDARDLMALAAAILDRWADRLERVSRRLPSPSFTPDTDAPLDLAAAWQGALETIVNEELRPAVSSLRRAATWTEDSAGWRLRG